MVAFVAAEYLCGDTSGRGLDSLGGRGLETAVRSRLTLCPAGPACVWTACVMCCKQPVAAARSKQPVAAARSNGDR